MIEQSRQSWSKTASRWWWKTCSDKHGDPGVRARLRRARDRIEAMLVVEALTLAKSLVPDSRGTDKPFGLALDLARVLSHVRTDDNTHPMRTVGWENIPTGAADQARPKCSETRFRRFLLAIEGEDQVDAFIRLIDMMGGKADVGEIAEAFQWWGHPEGKRRQSWAFTYYNAAGFTPEAPTDTSSEESA